MTMMAAGRRNHHIEPENRVVEANRLPKAHFQVPCESFGDVVQMDHVSSLCRVVRGVHSGSRWSRGKRASDLGKEVAHL